MEFAGCSSANFILQTLLKPCLAGRVKEPKGDEDANVNKELKSQISTNLIFYMDQNKTYVCSRPQFQ